MTHNDHANPASPGLFGGPDRQAMFAEFIRSGIQQLIAAELTAALGAGRYERTEGRITHRNGTRPKTLATAGGDIELAIPKCGRARSFRRCNVDDLVAALGMASGISKSEVSRICAGLDVEAAAFRERTLNHTTLPYISFVPKRVQGCPSHVLQGAGRCGCCLPDHGCGDRGEHRRLL